ncbi:PREDICTED: C-type lectin domain family 12 member A-like [Buceros rhinoceros silvestris]|uniref:C-type lectin domain family 12 member A-like n=1 Tax=Buceros rhinoceros silvestris TaxID=175836 RepID=UPI00052903C5|nr:PREDICTED: C-type lectin domain family 12 member A-like [Buceros rhinoceros silvestris]
MTEEITYANLKFENSHELGNITRPEDTKEKGPPTSSHSCRPIVLVFSMLFLLSLMALVVLAVLLFQIPKDYRTQLRDLNTTKNVLHANFSNMLQAIGNQLCLQGEKDLQNNGPNCVLCPANWKWEGGDTCYYLSKEKKNWQQSQHFCSSQNSTLLLAKEKAKLELVANKFPGEIYWIGLRYRHEKGDWYWEDNTVHTEQQSWPKNKYYQEYCAYFYNRGASYGRCTDTLYFICEKPAIQLQRGNHHWQEDWFVRLKSPQPRDYIKPCCDLHLVGRTFGPAQEWSLVQQLQEAENPDVRSVYGVRSGGDLNETVLGSSLKPRLAIFTFRRKMPVFDSVTLAPQHPFSVFP